jgi:hypothetical protein
MDKVQKHNSFNTNTPSSESYKNDLCLIMLTDCVKEKIKSAFPRYLYSFRLKIMGSTTKIQDGIVVVQYLLTYLFTYLLTP